MSVTVKYSSNFLGSLHEEIQWHVNQNKMAVDFLKITCYSLGKVTSLLGGKVCLICPCFKILENFLV